MGQENAVAIVCEGGLDRSKNPHQMFQFPGAALELQNFEPALDGGYRRISGYKVYGTSDQTWIPDQNTPVLGIYGYATGLIRCQGAGVFFSVDGYTWTTLTNGRTNAGKYSIVNYEGDSTNYTYGTSYIADGVNPIGKITIPNPASPAGTYSELGASTGAPQDASILEIHRDRLFAVGSSQPNVLYWSGRFTPNDFTISSAGYIELTDNIVVVKSFRERLFIFCKSSIHVLDNIDDPAQLSVTPVTKNLGCVCKFTIQEVGGDLIFLSHDGFRNLSATEKIGDVALSTISSQIQDLIPDILVAASTGCLNSLVIRNKNQYRMFYPSENVGSNIQKGIIGVLKAGQAGIAWEWSTIKGIESTACCSVIDDSGVERVFHGDYDGYVYEQEVGNTFNTIPIQSAYRTPYINFQDSSGFKTIHYLRIPLVVEGTISENTVKVFTRYDFEDVNVAQPTFVYMGGYSAPAIYGDATYNGNIYGAQAIIPVKVLQEGSGHSVSWRFFCNVETAPYTFNGFTIVFTSGKRL